VDGREQSTKETHTKVTEQKGIFEKIIKEVANVILLGKSQINFVFGDEKESKIKFDYKLHFLLIAIHEIILSLSDIICRLTF
jgi:hypothetical protein